MKSGIVIEIISIVLFISGLLLIFNYANWELGLGIFLFVSGAKIDILKRMKYDNGEEA